MVEPGDDQHITLAGKVRRQAADDPLGADHRFFEHAVALGSMENELTVRGLQIGRDASISQPTSKVSQNQSYPVQLSRGFQN
jgi:hypothetical protein